MSLSVPYNNPFFYYTYMAYTLNRFSNSMIPIHGRVGEGLSYITPDGVRHAVSLDTCILYQLNIILFIGQMSIHRGYRACVRMICIGLQYKACMMRSKLIGNWAQHVVRTANIALKAALTGPETSNNHLSPIILLFIFPHSLRACGLIGVLALSYCLSSILMLMYHFVSIVLCRASFGVWL